MEARVSLVTLGVEDFERALGFYRDGLGWPLSSAGSEDVAFFRTGGVVLALYRRDLLADDVGVSKEGTGFSGVTLAHNVAERKDVDLVLDEAAAAGAELVKAAEDVFWGGRVGYFADPDGHLWEVAWNPGFPFAPDGTLVLPE
jgi:uncharacterized glyoxalase superfamily protein PhnB